MTTKDRILDSAERLFARDGFEATSLRAITAEANVNLAAVNYHFQSKEALVQAVIGRRMGPVNAQRIALLDACEAEAGDAPFRSKRLWMPSCARSSKWWEATRTRICSLDRAPLHGTGRIRSPAF